VNLLILPGLKGLKWIQSLTAALDVKNVGDVSFRDAQNFPLPGRMFLGTVEARF
jgi:hypothetical protein